MGRCAKVIEDFTPRAVFGGTATMALVNDDQVKETGAEFPIGIFVFVIQGNGGAKDNFATRAELGDINYLCT